MSQIATTPASLRHTMSLMPSPLKSPVPSICQFSGTLPSELAWRSTPSFMAQIAVLPASLRHNRSLLPSPLKSPVPAMVQLVGTVPSELPCRIAVSFMSQIAVTPASLRQTMSLMPSPLKSDAVVPPRTLSENCNLSTPNNVSVLRRAGAQVMNGEDAARLPGDLVIGARAGILAVSMPSTPSGCRFLLRRPAGRCRSPRTGGHRRHHR